MSFGRSHILLLFLLLLTLPTFSQVRFNQHYDTRLYENGVATLETDNGYVVASSSAMDNLLWWSIDLLFLDQNGQQQQLKSYSKPFTAFRGGAPGSFSKVSAGGFVLAGGMSDTIGTKAVLWRFDDQGDTLWTKTIGDTNWHRFYAVRPVSGGGFIAVGGKGPSSELGDYWLVRFDSVGGFQWEKTFTGGVYFDLATDVRNTLDGGFVITGQTNPSMASSDMTMVIKTDGQGNEEWREYITGPQGSFHWNVLPTQDSGFVLSGQKIENSINDASRLSLVKLDQNGQLLWDSVYAGIGLTALFTAFELPNGDLVAGGTALYDSVYHGVVLRTTAMGDSIWMRRLDLLKGGESDHQMRDLKPTSDGGMIGTGWINIQPPDSGFQDIWVVKLDSNGCVNEFCAPTHVPEVATRPEFESWPNPFGDQLLVRTDPEDSEPMELTVLNALGQSVHSEVVSPGTTLSILTRDWPSGMYVVTVSGPSGRSTHKLIKP